MFYWLCCFYFFISFTNIPNFSCHVRNIKI
uniref:Uncharacterized protein n=1 Tax=Podoviridae sp. ctLPy3 TaxID=2825244 RepID=A0A8S5UWB0_9CAUD|nr:MAG TPA: hypothetical protein [Caudoviricetes sp.]DAF98773.1 MAG TPA: hypothetical protein [Podoviridae sp. ctLPy3]